ncbi:MAG: copper resistance system multicopper oxidase [Phormidesmis sp.]
MKIDRRNFLRFTAGASIGVGLNRLSPAYARQPLSTATTKQNISYPDVINLKVQETAVKVGGKSAKGITVNGSMPGPLVRIKEGQTVTINVDNQLAESTSIHWHGLTPPPDMDGVPGVSFAGIKAGETFTYKFPVNQSGTYWYHSHSGLQEQSGHYGPLIVDPIEPEPFEYDQDYVVMLSDWTFEDPHKVLSKLKTVAGYYNYQRRTGINQLGDAAWNSMRMDPTDIADVTGATYTYLMNGLAADDNWTGLFEPGNKVRLRFINGSAMTFFDVRIPGLKMQVVQADSQNVQPVEVDEFRIGVAETYDVIVEPQADQAYTVFAETMDRSGYARGTLATKAGLSAAIPALRDRPLRTMADMGMVMSEDGAGMENMPGMGKSSTKGSTMDPNMPGMSNGSTMDPKMPGMGNGSTMDPNMPGMGNGSTMDPKMPGMGNGSTMDPNMPGMGNGSTMDPNMPGMDMPGMDSSEAVPHGPDTHGLGNATVPMMELNRLSDPGVGLENTGTKVLVYSDLRSLSPLTDQRAPERELELHLTGNMERYMWSFDGKKYSEDKEITFYNGERLRLIYVNDTMMEHPIHLHGMFVELDTGAGAYNPLKHTVVVKPAERLALNVSVDAPGKWAFHCHLLYHMEAGMFRTVAVVDRTMGAG